MRSTQTDDRYAGRTQADRLADSAVADKLVTDGHDRRRLKRKLHRENLAEDFLIGSAD